MRPTLALFMAYLMIKINYANPYINKQVYVIDDYITNVSMSIQLHSNISIQRDQYIPVFYWINSITKISKLSTILESAMNQQIRNNSQVLKILHLVVWFLGW